MGNKQSTPNNKHKTPNTDISKPKAFANEFADHMKAQPEEVKKKFIDRYLETRKKIILRLMSKGYIQNFDFLCTTSEDGEISANDPNRLKAIKINKTIRGYDDPLYELFIGYLRVAPRFEICTESDPKSKGHAFTVLDIRISTCTLNEELKEVDPKKSEEPTSGQPTSGETTSEQPTSQEMDDWLKEYTEDTGPSDLFSYIRIFDKKIRDDPVFERILDENQNDSVKGGGIRKSKKRKKRKKSRTRRKKSKKRTKSKKLKYSNRVLRKSTKRRKSRKS